MTPTPLPPLPLRNAIVTEARYDNATQTLFGAVYDEMCRRVESALRLDMGAWKHGDPLVLDVAPPARRIEKAVYAGRIHAHFGHFLIESLPALWRVREGHTTIVCHPWGAQLTEAQLNTGYRAFLLEAIGLDPARVVLAREALRVDDLHVHPYIVPPIMGNVSRTLVPDLARLLSERREF